ncbi:MAG: glycosyltransferase family 4 protein [bacterium]|nr:glycosyltransferase family 4 protein [bacterium]
MPYSGKVLHILSQRPLLTGSGITLDAYVRCARACGWRQAAAVGVPADEPVALGDLEPERIFPLRFERGLLDFPVPGMSDIMPYRSTIFSSMNETRLHQYRQAWMDHLRNVLAAFRPDLIHSHHIWLLSSLLKEIAPDIPIVTSCHATGLRQMELCPGLADEVRRGCARNDHFIVLTAEHATALIDSLGLESERVTVQPPGYRADLFHDRGRSYRSAGRRLCYVGKFSEAKGLSCLLTACEVLQRDFPDLELHVAGGGDSDEANALGNRLAGMNSFATRHGQLSQAELADLMRKCDLLVLPSFYEGVPLVLVEARAAGCRVVATDLPGIRSELFPVLGDELTLIPLPEMASVDRPAAEAIPDFIHRLVEGIGEALGRQAPVLRDSSLATNLHGHSWEAVFQGIESTWLRLIGRG